jgi:hypothetical protein
MNVKVKVYYVTFHKKHIYYRSYIVCKKHAYNRHDVAMLTLLFGQPREISMHGSAGVRIL